MFVRRLVVPLLSALLVLSAGCGGSDTARDTGAGNSSATSTTAQTGGAVPFTLVALVNETAAGGAVAPQASPLTNADDVDAFSAQFRTPRLAAKLHDLVAATQVPAGKVLYAAVVAVGCVPPQAVTVTEGPSALLLNPVAGPKHPNIECLAAVTTVAVVMVDENVANHA